jgi:hypothetical protein
MPIVRRWLHAHRRWLILVLVCLMLLLLPSPLSRAYAEFWARTALQLSQIGTIDGCGFDCQGCGAMATQKTLLGYSVQLEYACGSLPYDDPKYHQRRTVFVSFLGTVHGWP